MYHVTGLSIFRPVFKSSGASRLRSFTSSDTRKSSLKSLMRSSPGIHFGESDRDLVGDFVRLSLWSASSGVSSVRSIVVLEAWRFIHTRSQRKARRSLRSSGLPAGMGVSCQPSGACGHTSSCSLRFIFSPESQQMLSHLSLSLSSFTLASTYSAPGLSFRRRSITPPTCRGLPAGRGQSSGGSRSSRGCFVPNGALVCPQRSGIQTLADRT
jgi:hypothetical protein